MLIGIIFSGSLASVAWLFPGHKGLLTERLKLPIQKGQPLADKIVLVFFLISFYGLITFIPMDVFRFHLISGPGILVSSSGLFLFLGGWWIVLLALRENAFASPVVKLQEEREQKVVDTGVYGVVRHPMYAGGILFIVGIPLWLESYAGVLLSVVPIGTMVLRVLIEERFLRRQLKGYVAYMKRVRYRLIPFLW
jgi:protein-S-isoprenylcysteine O-methyltransferase Ste14